MSYGLTALTQPTALVVSLDQAKTHLRVDGSETNSQILDLIAAGTRTIQKEMNRQLLTATYRFDIPRFPCGRQPIYLPLAPLQSVQSVQYYDTNNSIQTIDASNYLVITSQEPGFVKLLPDYVYPMTYNRPDAVQVSYTAGYGSTGDSVPSTIKLALLMLLGGWFNNPESVSTLMLREVPIGVKRLLTLESVGDDFLDYWRVQDHQYEDDYR